MSFKTSPLEPVHSFREKKVDFSPVEGGDLPVRLRQQLDGAIALFEKTLKRLS